MGDVVNLRRIRKAMQKTEAATQAGANRARHGLTRTERMAMDAAANLLRRTLDGAALDSASAWDGKPRE